MHTCPDCGQACDCHGDIDDVELDTEGFYCTHVCGEYDDDADWYDDDEEA